MIALWDGGHYELAATVETTSPETAYILTNSIDRHWHENRGVECYGHEPRRSTSIGDIVVIDKIAFACVKLGFERVYIPDAPECEGA